MPQNVKARTQLPRSGRRAVEPDNESTTKNHWNTPQPVVDALHEFTGGKPVALDPCSNETSIVDADVEWYGPDAGGTDGLMVPWELGVGRRTSKLIFVNPPYSEKFLWMRKCHDEARNLAASGVNIISLLPADTDTNWFHRYCAHAAGRCFWCGRLKFMGDRGDPARFPSLLVHWGMAIGHFRGIFGNYGWVV